MSVFTAVDLSRLPAPNVVEPLDFETIFNEMLADLRQRDIKFTTLSEADPAYKVLQVAAFREMLLRQRVNDASRANMLAYATGSDLDHIVAREPYNIARLLIDAGDPDAVPPIPPTWEDNEALRRRAQLAPERYSTAGPEGAYIFHALGADPRVLDASVDSPSPGQVLVTIQGRAGNGVPPADLLDIVRSALNDEDVRPLTEEVIVQGGSVVEYETEAVLTLYEGPDQDLVLATALARLDEYRERVRRLGLDVSRSGLSAALHCEGVQDVDLIKPAANVAIASHQVSWCTRTAVTVGGRNA